MVGVFAKLRTFEFPRRVVVDAFFRSDAEYVFGPSMFSFIAAYQGWG